MKKYFILVISLFLFITISAQNEFSVKYIIADDEWAYGINDKGGLAYKIELHNAPKGNAELIEYQIENGKIIIKSVIDITIDNDIETFFIALYEQKRNIQFHIKIKNQIIERELSIHTDNTINNIFMQTYVDEIDLKEIPVFAYTTGLPKYDDDNRLIGRDYCGLRDAHIHPKLWFEKLEQKHYIYYTIKYKE